jgi:phosphatidylglycerol:prolipoprotein diacylglycerol transferase
VLDIASLGFLIGQSIGRWGNFINQEAFGTETNLPWRMVSENTANVGVHPCFLYESLWCILGFVLLHIFSRKFRRYDGQVFLIYMIWYGTGRFFIEGLRTDSLITPVIPLRISQVVAAIAVLASIVLLVVFRNRTALTGCGSAKIMELNSIIDEVPVAAPVEEEPALEGESTIFANSEDAEEALAGEPEGVAQDKKTEDSDSGDDAESEDHAEASVTSETSEPAEDTAKDAGEKQ